MGSRRDFCKYKTDSDFGKFSYPLHSAILQHPLQGCRKSCFRIPPDIHKIHERPIFNSIFKKYFFQLIKCGKIGMLASEQLVVWVEYPSTGVVVEFHFICPLHLQPHTQNPIYLWPPEAAVPKTASEGQVSPILGMKLSLLVIGAKQLFELFSSIVSYVEEISLIKVNT